MPREIEELREEYAQGSLDKIKGDLELFLKSHKEPIKRFSAHYGIGLDIGLRWYILLKRSINTKRENYDQMEEMKRELWYRHEEDPSTPDGEILKDWTLKHSAGWRDHRILQIIYVFLQDPDRYLRLLA